MFNEQLFDRDPRSYAISLVEDYGFDAKNLLNNCLVYMSHDQVRDMLDCNELSPRFYD